MQLKHTCSTVIFSALRLCDFEVIYWRQSTDLSNIVLIYITICCVLSENGFNSDFFLWKGHTYSTFNLPGDGGHFLPPLIFLQ